MTFIESHPSACSGQKRPAKVLRRIPAQPGNVGGVAAGGGEGFSTSGGTVHAGPSWLKMLTKEGVDSVHTLGFGFGCTGVGPGRIGEDFGRVADFQERRLVRVPSGTFSQVRGPFWASDLGRGTRLSEQIALRVVSHAVFVGSCSCGRLLPSLSVAAFCCLTASWGAPGPGRHDRSGSGGVVHCSE